MNTLASFYKAAVGDFHRRFDREQLVVIFDRLRSAPRTLLDGAQLIKMFETRMLARDQAPILAQLRKFSEWQTVCFQIWVFAFWDDGNASTPFESLQYAHFQGRHVRDYYTMHEAVQAVIQARNAIEGTQIANWHLDQARKTYLAAERKIQDAMCEC
jgi:hypothetical protein